jgi:hypothetical protein
MLTRRRTWGAGSQSRGFCLINLWLIKRLGIPPNHCDVAEIFACERFTHQAADTAYVRFPLHRTEHDLAYWMFFLRQKNLPH